jgi:sodium:dicarboxylate symporter family protein
MAVLFIAQATDIQLTIGQQLTMLFVMLFTSKGAAGVAGAGFVALAATMPALGILPVGGLALLLGVERFMSEIRAVTNLFSNIFATVVVARWMGELDDDRLRSVLDGDGDADVETRPSRRWRAKRRADPFERIKPLGSETLHQPAGWRVAVHLQPRDAQASDAVGFDRALPGGKFLD